MQERPPIIQPQEPRQSRVSYPRSRAQSRVIKKLTPIVNLDLIGVDLARTIRAQIKLMILWILRIPAPSESMRRLSQEQGCNDERVDDGHCRDLILIVTFFSAQQRTPTDRLPNFLRRQKNRRTHLGWERGDLVPATATMTHKWSAETSYRQLHWRARG